ncbi:TIGR02117 family protein [Sphingomonas panacisoli]|uniref:TIGR02117 family protein n=1 Tax=Sphingomonas panacisoli TaxID=1813879 RepID=A0A5B8LL90_9SPHN|nr:TIGR02117 family protein [Sphingomonas panacisoli]
MGRIATGLMGIVLAYAATGMIGGSIPANAAWVQPAEGIRIFIEDNGIHTGIVMPVSAAGVEWRGTFPASDLSDPRYANFDHVAVGWGERAFYIETPTWSDLNLAVVGRAAIGSNRTVLHVEHVPAPATGTAVRAIVLTPDQYRRLAAFVRETLGPRGKIAGGYGPDDAFYDARGTYSAVVTCNEWTGRALRHAGVRVGAWTPFPVTVMGWF